MGQLHNKMSYLQYVSRFYKKFCIWFQAGKLRAYNLGLWARARYAKLFEGRQYGSGFLKVTSSAKERTINSAQLFPAGFCPPNQRDVWHKDLPWFPIAVYPIASRSDNVSIEKIMHELRQVFKFL